jgi:FlaA1/EpsC-like NDP-sugar epimerase
MLRLIALLAGTEGMSWPRFWHGVRRYLAAIVIDGVVASVALLVALAVRFDGSVPPEYVKTYPGMALLVIALYAGSSALFKVYRCDWRFASLSDLLLLAEAVGTATVLLLLFDLLVQADEIRLLPFSVVLLTGCFTYLALVALKLRLRLLTEGRPAAYPATVRRTLIVGAGRTGERLVRELVRQPERGYLPVCFVDDDPARQGLRIHNVPVRGPTTNIPYVVDANGIDTIVIALPSVSGPAMRAIVDRCHETTARIVVAPGLGQYLEGSSSELLLRELRIEDLLGREMVQIDVVACREYLAGVTVLVTGAAGSIGSELCRQLVSLEPGRLVLFDNNESGLYDLALELQNQRVGGLPEVIACPGSVADGARVDGVLRQHRPAVVFHAAAYKHVPLMEEYPHEAVLANVLGTRNVAEAALRHGVERMVLISTDKAVYPSNVMGATKRVAELLVQALAQPGGTRYCAVRFGNVLGSRGSVVPTFARQIEWGGPVTVTDPDASRYMIAISEAARLIIQAGSFAEPRAIYILEMGEEVRILDLATKMIRFRGLRVGADIQIEYTGLRPGEKLREQLFTAEEATTQTPHSSIIKITSPPRIGASELFPRIDELVALARAEGSERLRAALWDIVEQARQPAEPAGTAPTIHRLEPVSGAHEA